VARLFLISTQGTCPSKIVPAVFFLDVDTPMDQFSSHFAPLLAHSIRFPPCTHTQSFTQVVYMLLLAPFSLSWQ